ncbi:hypothetical protein DRI50_03255 [candidate division KSB1 bacterium]|nr:MAG: hypothetical protein DRI50_03255 [candidate division KSB1 bacterium]
MDVTVNRFLKILLALLFFAALIWLTVKLSNIITIFIIGALLAYILDPITSFLEYKGMTRMQATSVVFLFLALFLFLFSYFVVPLIVDQVKVIQHTFSSGQGTESLKRMEQSLKESIPMLKNVNLDISARLHKAINHLSNSVFSLVGSLISLITTLVVIPFVVFFLLKDGRNIIKGMVSIIPNRHFEIALNLLYKTDQQIGGYLRGQFFDAAIIGFLSVIALWILHVPYFLLIGTFAGLANMVPFVGPLTGAIVAILVVFLSNGTANQMIMVAVAFGIIQLLDNVLVQPLVVAGSVQMHPLIVLFAVIIGGQFGGILGMFLAVPAAAVLKVLIVEMYQMYQSFNLTSQS